MLMLKDCHYLGLDPPPLCSAGSKPGVIARVKRIVDQHYQELAQERAYGQWK